MFPLLKFEGSYPCTLSDMITFYVLQGTGSAGATIRIYIEQFEPDVSKHDMDAQVALKPLIGMLMIISYILLGNL